VTYEEGFYYEILADDLLVDESVLTQDGNSSD
jgi:hypothetical protein